MEPFENGAMNELDNEFGTFETSDAFRKRIQSQSDTHFCSKKCSYFRFSKRMHDWKHVFLNGGDRERVLALNGTKFENVQAESHKYNVNKL